MNFDGKNSYSHPFFHICFEFGVNYHNKTSTIPEERFLIVYVGFSAVLSNFCLFTGIK